MIDLHSHTEYSDGSYTVKELLVEAEKKKLSVLSITDHNVIDAYDELKDADLRNLFSGKIINGVEITTTYNGEVIEILGYNFDLEIMRKLLKENVPLPEQKQIKEYELIRDRYISIGIKMNIDNIKYNSKKESSRIAFCDEIKKYPENHKYFLNQDSISTKSGFTRNEVYNPKSQLYVDESSLYPSLEKTISIIHESGGLAFLAHTFAYSNTIADQLDIILKNYKLDGLECYYTTFSKDQTDYLLSLCGSLNILKSGGSDFHGIHKNNHNLGTGNGSLSIDENLILNWPNK